MFRSVWEEFVTPVPVDAQGRIEEFMVNLGLVAPSLDAIRPDFPRWVPRLGSADIPLAPSPVGSDRVSDLLTLWMLQASPRKDKAARALGHHLRNITGTRPIKA
jgi:hypothetical protein